MSETPPDQAKRERQRRYRATSHGRAKNAEWQRLRRERLKQEEEIEDHDVQPTPII